MDKAEEVKKILRREFVAEGDFREYESQVDYEERVSKEIVKLFSPLRVTKETTAYKSEFLVIDCPYCGEMHYLDIEDDYGEGIIGENGRKMTCKKCNKTMRVHD